MEEGYGQGSSSSKLKSNDHNALMSDLRVATDKFFFGNATQQQENVVLPEIKDKAVLGELRKIIEEQRKELEANKTTIQALQRNFESLSALCLTERTDKANLQKLSEQLKFENKDFAQQLLACHEKIEKLEAQVADLSGQKKALEKVRDEHILLKATHESTKVSLDMKTEKVAKLEGEVEQQKQRIQELKQRISAQDQELRDKDRQKEEIRKEMREIEKQIDGLKAEIQKGLANAADKDKIIDALKKDIAERENKYNSLTDQFNKKQAQLKDYLTDLEKERQLKREAQKDLKQYQEQVDNFQLLLKSGEMSQDEQRKKISELSKRIA